MRPRGDGLSALCFFNASDPGRCRAGMLPCLCPSAPRTFKVHDSAAFAGFALGEIEVLRTVDDLQILALQRARADLLHLRETTGP